MKLLDFEHPVYEIEKRIEELKEYLPDHPELMDEIKALESQAQKVKEKIYSNLTPWQKVQMARHPERPHTPDFIRGMMDDFLEVHGDRNFGDDPSVIGGLARMENVKLIVIGQEKGRDTKEKIRRNFGMAHPEGYRKARRLMQLAEKFGLPILTLVDTPGAYPGIGAEERGQSMAIAQNLETMLALRAPLLTVIIGEGGSGGALAIAVGDRILALEYAIYSVISPEGCASILWRDGKEAPKASEVLKLTAEDLLALGVIDAIVPEPLGGAHKEPGPAIKTLKTTVLEHLQELMKKNRNHLPAQRRKRYERFGVVAVLPKGEEVRPSGSRDKPRTQREKPSPGRG